MTQTVKVALFRSEADHLFRLANVDYHACVGAHELRNWHTIAARVLAEVKHYECKRATPYDREQFRRAVGAVIERIDGMCGADRSKAANAPHFSG